MVVSNDLETPFFLEVDASNSLEVDPSTSYVAVVAADAVGIPADAEPIVDAE